MSRTADSSGRSEREGDASAHDISRIRDGEKGRHRSEDTSSERSSHRHRGERTRDRDRHEERDERRRSVGGSEGTGQNRGRDRHRDERDDDQLNADSKHDQSGRHRPRHDSDSENDRRSSRSHRSKRTRDDSKSDDSDDGRRERKHKKHSKASKDKKHKHRHNDDRQQPTELDRRIQHTKQQLALLSSPSTTATSTSPAVLTSDDYYLRSAEFRLWLHNSRSLHLDELDSDRARLLFTEFCNEWNSRRLPAVYYKGVDSSALSGSVLTGHKWGFVGVMSEEDKLANASVRDTVDTATYHHTYQQEFTPAALTTTTASPTLTGPSNAAVTVAAVPAATAASSSRPFAALSKGERRQHLRHMEAVMDEVAPRETGREAMLLKRREKGEYSRRGEGGDGMEEMDDDVLMGGGGGASELVRLKERDSQRREKRNTEQAAKRSEWDRKEKDKMRAMLQSIGQADKYNL